MNKKQQRQQKMLRQQEIVNAAKEAGRDLTAEEQTEFDSLQREIERLNGEIEAEKQQQRGMNPPANAPPQNPANPEADTQRAIQEERARIRSITELCGEFGMEARSYIESGATLAGMFFARGMTTIVNTKPFNVANENFTALKETRVFVPGMGSVNKLGNYVNAYVEIGVIVALMVVIVMFVMLRWTKMGRSFYAVGGNNQSALMLGINVKRTKFLSHLLCGLLAGIGGYVYFLHVGSGSASHATGMEMNAIASSIIGGTMLTGGVGNIIGTFFGVLSLSTIQNIVSSAGLDQAWWTGITIAAMLCLFLVVQSVVIARKKKMLQK